MSLDTIRNKLLGTGTINMYYRIIQYTMNSNRRVCIRFRERIIWSASLKIISIDMFIPFHVYGSRGVSQLLMKRWTRRDLLRDSPLSDIVAVIRSESSGTSGEFVGTKWTCSPRPARCKSRSTWPCNCNVRSISYRLVLRFPYRV